MQVVARTIGTALEQVVGTGEIDLVDLVAGLTRVVFINVNCGGVVNIRLKARAVHLALFLKRKLKVEFTFPLSPESVTIFQPLSDSF